MKNFSQQMLVLFAILSFANLIAVGSRVELLNFATKPLLISSLALWYYFRTRANWHLFSRFFLIGLVFSVLGDTLLMFVKMKGEIYFLLGLGSFLLAHLCYIAAFFKFPNFKSGIIWVNKWMALPFLIILTSLLCVLWNSLGAFLVPVAIYASVIVTMFAFSFNMRNRVDTTVSKMLFGGAALFVLSDLIIAMKKFKYPEMGETLSGVAIMVTYLLGQVLLALGMGKASDDFVEKED
ncbi:MAG: lysoplasmalogenase [Saprospiraceae bacterium]|nr:lysoplasmalogenase [Saprospiraceae bacterium]